MVTSTATVDTAAPATSPGGMKCRRTSLVPAPMGMASTRPSARATGTSWPFTVALVPHTLAATTLGTLTPGQAVNLEVDVIAKYVERLVTPGLR